jgi:signal peptidase I
MPIQPQEFVEGHVRVIDSREQNHDRIKLDLAADLLRNGEQARLSVLGTSMLPTIWPRDMVSISKIEYGDIAAGDIIAIARADKILIHRVIGKRHGWVTRGDSASQADSPINATELLGKVISIQRGSRKIVPRRASTLQRISGWFLCNSDHIRNLALTWHARRTRHFVHEGFNN